MCPLAAVTLKRRDYTIIYSVAHVRYSGLDCESSVNRVTVHQQSISRRGRSQRSPVFLSVVGTAGHGGNQMKSATIRQRTSSVENQAVISAMLEPLSATLASMLRTVARAMPHSFAIALMLVPAAFISASR